MNAKSAEANIHNKHHEDERKNMVEAISWNIPLIFIACSSTPNVEVTGAARLYRAASGGPQGYACS
jgi:hypothetical protein